MTTGLITPEEIMDLDTLTWKKIDDLNPIGIYDEVMSSKTNKY